MNTTMADGAEQRLDAQIAEALFGQPGMSKMDVANRVRELRGDGPALLGPREMGQAFAQGCDELRMRTGGERAAYLEGVAEGRRAALSAQPSPGATALGLPIVVDPTVPPDTFEVRQPSPGGQGGSMSISDDDRAVLQRLQDALPTAGINGWAKGVEVLERLLRDSLAARQPVGEPVCEVSRETFSSDGTSDIIKPNLPIGTKLYAAPPAQAVGTQPLGCTECPVTGLPFYDNMEHPERGLIAMYGGPFDVYSVPELQEQDGELRRERYDLDADCWVEGGEPLGYFYREQQPDPAPVGEVAELEPDDDQGCTEAFGEFAEDYLTDGHGYAPASTYEACGNAFKAAWPDRGAAVEAARAELKRLHGDDRTVGARRAEALNRADARQDENDDGDTPEDRVLSETIDQRDRYHEMADELAGHIARITGVDIGEHSSANCPWQNAIEAAEAYQPAQAVDLAQLPRYEAIGSDGMNMERISDGRWVKLDDVRALIDGKAVGK